MTQQVQSSKLKAQTHKFQEPNRGRARGHQGLAEEKRRRGGALLQNLADVRGRVEVAIASWSAGVLSRFRDGPALSRGRECLDRPGHARRKAPQGRRTPKPGGRSRARGGRDSVLECGSPVPLSRRSGPQSRPGASRSSRTRPKKSAAGRRISKTGRTFERPWPTRQRFGVRESCPAFAMDRPSVETGGVSIVQGPMVATRRAAIGVLWAWSLEFCASFAL